MNYIPVHVGDSVKFIQSYDNTYPVKYLLEAERLLNGKSSKVAYTDRGGDIRMRGTDYAWSVPDIAMALRSYHTSMETKFWFHQILDEQHVCRLLVSSKVGKDSCLLADAVTFESVLICDRDIMARLYDMTKIANNWIRLGYIFRAIVRSASEDREFLPYVLVDKDKEYPYYALSPVLTRTWEILPYVTDDDIATFANVMDGGVGENGEYVQNSMFYRPALSYWKPVSCRYLSNLFSELHSLRNTRITYVPVRETDTYGDALYVSCDLRHVVHAFTFEHVIVKNVYLMNRLKDIVRDGYADMLTLSEIWQLLSGEVYSA